MLDNPAIIRAKVFPYDTSLTDDKVEQVQAEILKAGKVIRYTAEGKRLLQIVNWWTYQTPSWASPSKYPAPADWIDRVKYHTAGNKIIMKNWELQGGLQHPPNPGLPSKLPSGIEEGEGEGDDDVKGEGEGKEEASPPPNIYKLYESEIGPLTSMISEGLKIAEKEYPSLWFPVAFREAADHNARSWKYVEAILKRWKVDGFQTKSNGRHAPTPPPPHETTSDEIDLKILAQNRKASHAAIRKDSINRLNQHGTPIPQELLLPEEKALYANPQ